MAIQCNQQSNDIFLAVAILQIKYNSKINCHLVFAIVSQIHISMRSIDNRKSKKLKKKRLTVVLK